MVANLSLLRRVSGVMVVANLGHKDGIPSSLPKYGE